MSLWGLLNRSTFRKYSPSSPKKIKKLRPLHRVAAQQSPVFDQQQLQSVAEMATAAREKRSVDSVPPTCLRSRRRVGRQIRIADSKPALGRPYRQHVKEQRVRNQQREIQHALNDRQIATWSGTTTCWRPRRFQQAVGQPGAGQPLLLGKTEAVKRFLKPLAAEQPGLRAAYRPPHERRN